MPNLLELDDLDLDEFESIIAHAADLRKQQPDRPARPPVMGSLFASSSLRTRAGFETAAHRLGWDVVSTEGFRFDPTMSGAESLEDTIRTLSGMVDALVVRAPVDLGAVLDRAQPTCPVVCGGDASNHPTQTLIDIAAIRALKGHERHQRIALYGDLTMRAASSLLNHFERLAPAELRLIAAPGREAATTRRSASFTSGGPLDLDDIGILYVVGLPKDRNGVVLDDDQRRPFIIGDAQLDVLPDDAVILSPLPVVDELSDAARSDPRLRIWEQNELSVSVRMAALAYAIGPDASVATGGNRS